jgi:hypothetical protein
MMNNYSQINVYLYAGIGGVFYNPKVNDAMQASPNYDPNHSKMGIVFSAGVGVNMLLARNGMSEPNLVFGGTRQII